MFLNVKVYLISKRHNILESSGSVPFYRNKTNKRLRKIERECVCPPV